MSEHPSRYARTILMGDPSHFSVQGGANPHTRTRWGTRRSVDRNAAIDQWHALKKTLEGLGIRVLVVPPDAAQPGLVYPANAGYQSDVDLPEPIEDKRFTLSNLLPTRAGEKAHYRRLLEALGMPLVEIDPALRFEGEADFFPAGDRMLLTHGALEKQRFVPAFAFPPWKRVYGFRTDVRVKPLLVADVAPRIVTSISLHLEAHYHGDTALCAFGPGRKFLLGYREALSPADWKTLASHFGDRLIELSEADAKRYAANSFTYTPSRAESEGIGGSDGAAPASTDSYLVMPGGISGALQSRVRDRGVTPIIADVSEFLKKGGGSVKCMIGDLGLVGGGA